MNSFGSDSFLSSTFTSNLDFNEKPVADIERKKISSTFDLNKKIKIIFRARTFRDFFLLFINHGLVVNAFSSHPQFYTNHMKAIKIKQFQNRRKRGKRRRRKNWFDSPRVENQAKEETRLGYLFISARKWCWSNTIVLSLKSLFRDANDIGTRRGRDRMMKKGRDERMDLSFYAFVSCLHFVPRYKSKLFETRQNSHKV